jgi:tRNA A-37 threonylcarbamoyl transferase component Bud32
VSDVLQEQLQTSFGSAYTLARELGGGGMSRVFVARDEALGRDVVIKVLAPELAAGLSAERFTREIRLAAALQEPHIVPVHAAGATADGLPWYTMPYVEGESLRERLQRGPIPIGEALGILRDVARALAYAHARGIVHRDIKPENVLLSSGTAVVTDFGIAKALQASRTQAPAGTLTQVGTSLGTPAYMAPEQAAGDDVDHRADLYAWGVVAYELLRGRHPFAGKTSAQQMIAAHIAEVPAPLGTAAPDVPPALAALVMQCLAKSPVARPASAEELLRRLDDVAVASGAGAHARPRARRIVLAGGAVAVSVALLVIAGLVWRRGGVTAAPALEPTRVVVATFANRTGDASLDPLGAMAADWIARGLASTGLVDVAGTANDLAARAANGAPAATHSLAGLAAAAKAGLVISGAYYRQGDSVRFEADFTDANAGKRTQSVGPVTAPVANPLDGVERLRQRVTASLATMLDPRLAALSTRTNQPPSIDAYREFLAGEDVAYFDPAAAVPHFTRAAALDSAYVFPQLRMMTMLADLPGRAREADSIGRRLARRADRLSDFERAYLDGLLARVRNDLEGQYRANMRMLQAAPKSDFARLFLALSAGRTGRFRQADSIYATLDPEGGELRGRSSLCTNRVRVLHALGAHARQLTDGVRACRQFSGRIVAPLPKVVAYAALGREPELRVALEEVFAAPPQWNATPTTVAADAVYDLRAHGHADAAGRVAARLVAWHDGSTSRAGAHAPFERARALAAAGAWERLAPLADSLVAERPGDVARLEIQGFARAMRGDRAGAGRAAAAIARLDGTFERGRDRDARGLIAAALGDRAAAVELLRQAYPGGRHPTLYHVTPVYELLRGYPPFEAMIRPVP